jgi:hypothetical protein
MGLHDGLVERGHFRQSPRKTRASRARVYIVARDGINRLTQNANDGHGLLLTASTLKGFRRPSISRGYCHRLERQPSYGQACGSLPGCR